MKLTNAWLAALLALAAATGAQAAEVAAKPARPRPITVIVPFANGGPTDELAEILVEAMTRTLQQKVVARNVVGAGGTLGSEQVARARPDGSILLLSNLGQATSVSVYPKLRYDPVADFEPVGLVAEVPMTLVARRGLGAKNLKDVQELAKTGLSYGHAGKGSASHLCGLLFMEAIHSDLSTVSYLGTREALFDLVGGRVDLMCDQPTNTLKAIQAGEVKALAVTSTSRLEILPQVPTMTEAGVPVDLVVWHGLYAPKGTPPAVIDKLATGLRRALLDPTLQARLSHFGAHPATPSQASPEALRTRLVAEVQRWQPVIRQTAIYAD